jgi:hypothetical protein
VSVIFIQVDQTGQPITPSWRLESTVYGNSLPFKENPASKKASKVRRSSWSESTLQRNLTAAVDLTEREVAALAAQGEAVIDLLTRSTDRPSGIRGFGGCAVLKDKRFFFEKKKQKTFEGFWFFFQKEPLPCG